MAEPPTVWGEEVEHSLGGAEETTEGESGSLTYCALYQSSRRKRDN